MKGSADASMHKYLMIYNDLRHKIALNEYPAGTLLPPETELMQMYSAGRNTVRHAIALLRDKGLVSSLRGSGVTVLPSGSEYGRKSVPAHINSPKVQFVVENEGDGIYDAAQDSISCTAPAVDMLIPPAQVAEAFSMAEGTPVYRLQRLWKSGGRPVMYMIQYFNADMLPDLLRHLGDHVASIYRVIENNYGLHFLDGKEKIRCVNADFLKANLLGMEIGQALLHTNRISNCEAGTFEYADIYANPQYAYYSVAIEPDLDPEAAFREEG